MICPAIGLLHLEGIGTGKRGKPSTIVLPKSGSGTLRASTTLLRAHLPHGLGARPLHIQSSMLLLSTIRSLR